MKKIRNLGIIFASMLVAFVVSCASTGMSADEQAIERGVTAWNSREPAAASAYWKDIVDAKLQKKYLNYVTLYQAGVEALNSSDSVKSTNESKLLSLATTALDKFSALDPQLTIPADVSEKGAVLTSARVDKLLAAEKIAQARNMYNSAVKVYGENDSLAAVKKELDVVNSIVAKKDSLNAQAAKAMEMSDFDAKIASLDSTIESFKQGEGELTSVAAKSGTSSTAGVSNNIRSFRNARQDLIVRRESVIREKAYEYKDAIGEEFARQPEGEGSGKNGSFTLEEILAHYKSVEANINTKYDELLTFSSKYPKEIGKDIIDDINAQKNDLQAKIAQINKEIAYKKEVESRGKTVLPLMVGLFNPAPGSTAESKKSRPAKFSATKQKDSEYWWGMVSIPKGQLNDLVITLKDNRTVRVFNENTKSGKLIEKNNMKDLVNRAYKVGNSWPVLNAGSQLTTDKYFFEIQKGKTDSYSGEVVVYSSFVVRMR
ncbi:hypothetical protein [Treponema pectinovorum]|uniref:hypothetical protein n=1 Tax=Treponema pectinovorum TaxID=164 RepID=UPI0011C85671|nr:hypothetical protein [Treponema pectinovorum]